jgi:hypothetical protein
MNNRRWLAIAIALTTALMATVLGGSEYSTESYDKSPGIYYESKGTAVLFNVVWKIIVYVDLNNVNRETLALRHCVHHIEMLCQNSVVRNSTGCDHFNEASDRLSQIGKSEMFLKGITDHNGGSKRKRCVFNLIGELSKILFGTMDDDDAKYNEQIKAFEQNSGHDVNETTDVGNEILIRGIEQYPVRR